MEINVLNHKVKRTYRNQDISLAIWGGTSNNNTTNQNHHQFTLNGRNFVAKVFSDFLNKFRPNEIETFPKNGVFVCVYARFRYAHLFGSLSRKSLSIAKCFSSFSDDVIYFVERKTRKRPSSQKTVKEKAKCRQQRRIQRRQQRWLYFLARAQRINFAVCSVGSLVFDCELL